MHLFRSQTSRRATLAAASLAGAAMLLLAVPSRGQQNPQPNIRFGVGAALRGHRRVDSDFTVPSGLKLVGLPRVTVFDSKGKLVELWRMYLLEHTPAFKAYQTLEIKNYPPGAYQAKVEIDCLLPNGTKKTFTTPGTAITVPQR